MSDFDSFKQVFIIRATMPLALVGIVVNNGIVMADAMNRYLIEKRSAAKAAPSSPVRRLRPTVTTSVIKIAGMVPLAISTTVETAIQRLF
ncbi:efflux RND transporter permease subunit [Roseibium sp.]|uniref:efflux RND transporter permease subunit n=1 Tax=Roseibium sp. TaxID=1936156 RepID=UPI003299FAC0